MDTKVEEEQQFLIQNLPKRELFDEYLKENEEDCKRKLSMMEQVGGIWSCKVCGKSLGQGSQRKSKLKTHVEIHLDGDQYRCKPCNKFYKTWDNLSIHFKDSEHILQRFGSWYKKETVTQENRTETAFNLPELPATVEPMTLMEEVGGVWTCRVCGKQCLGPIQGVNKSHMKAHVETHIEGLQYTCTICSKTYRTKDVLRGHFNRSHKVKLAE